MYDGKLRVKKKRREEKKQKCVCFILPGTPLHNWNVTQTLELTTVTIQLWCGTYKSRYVAFVHEQTKGEEPPNPYKINSNNVCPFSNRKLCLLNSISMIWFADSAMLIPTRFKSDCWPKLIENLFGLLPNYYPQ